MPRIGLQVLVEDPAGGIKSATIVKNYIYHEVIGSGFGLVDVAISGATHHATVLLFFDRQRAKLSGQLPAAYFPDRAEEDSHAS